MTETPVVTRRCYSCLVTHAHAHAHAHARDALTAHATLRYASSPARRTPPAATHKRPPTLPTVGLRRTRYRTADVTHPPSPPKTAMRRDGNHPCLARELGGGVAANGLAAGRKGSTDVQGWYRGLGGPDE